MESVEEARRRLFPSRVVPPPEAADMGAFRGGRMDESGESSRPHVVRFKRDVVDVDPVEVDQRKLPEKEAESRRH